MVKTVVGGTPSLHPPLYVTYWLKYGINLNIGYLLAMALVLLVAVMLTGSREDKQRLRARLNQPLSWILLSFVLVLGVGTFTKLGYLSSRVSLDLTTFTSLTVAVLLGLGLSYYRKWPRYAVATAAVLLLVIPVKPWQMWLTDYSSFRPCDIQAVTFLTALPGDQLDIQVADTVDPSIYQLYTNGRIKYKRVFDLDSVAGADYFVFRDDEMNSATVLISSSSMVRKTASVTSLDWNIAPSEYNLAKVAEFQSGHSSVIVYKVNR
jgi:hypothetical protein